MVLTIVRVSGSIRASVRSSRFPTQPASVPAATGPGRMSPSTAATTRFSDASTTATELGGAKIPFLSPRNSRTRVPRTAAAATTKTAIAVMRDLREPNGCLGGTAAVRPGADTVGAVGGSSKGPESCLRIADPHRGVPGSARARAHRSASSVSRGSLEGVRLTTCPIQRQHEQGRNSLLIRMLCCEHLGAPRQALARRPSCFSHPTSAQSARSA